MSLSDAKKRIKNMLPAGASLTAGEIWEGLNIQQTQANEALARNALLTLRRENAIVLRNGKYMRA